MAKEIQFTGTAGATHYVLVFNSVGQVWRTTTSAFVTYAAGDYADYDVAATEFGASGIFSADMSASMGAGVFSIVAKRRVGGSPAQPDPTVAAGDLHWDSNRGAGGQVVARNEVANYTPPESVSTPGDLNGMIRRVFERGQNKKTRDRSSGAVVLRNAADDGNLETRTQSTSGTVDTQTAGA